MSDDNDLSLPDLGAPDDIDFSGMGGGSGPIPEKSANDLEQIFDVPVTVSAVLGHTSMPVGDLLQMMPGNILKLDRKVGEAIEIYVNNRLVARGEVVLVDDRLGVTMTEIVKVEN
jgi:flagellar motor switch protein FliN/FliY